MHEIIFEEPAKQFIRKLSKDKQKEILDKISQLKNNPSLEKPLVGKLSGARRLSISEFKVIYTIKDIELIVLILKVNHRKNIYN